jgi:hypothetical protein
MSVFEFPMVFPADGASLVGRVYRNVDELVTPQPAVVVISRIRRSTWLRRRAHRRRCHHHAARLRPRLGPRRGFELGTAAYVDRFVPGECNEPGGVTHDPDRRAG